MTEPHDRYYRRRRRWGPDVRSDRSSEARSGKPAAPAAPEDIVTWAGKFSKMTRTMLRGICVARNRNWSTESINTSRRSTLPQWYFVGSTRWTNLFLYSYLENDDLRSIATAIDSAGIASHNPIGTMVRSVSAAVKTGPPVWRYGCGNGSELRSTSRLASIFSGKALRKRT
jgi:hypothetical protein